MNEVILNATHGAEDGTQLLTVLEARQRLRISKWKLYDLMNRRLLEYVHIGSRRFIPVDALRKYVNQIWRESFA
ncbi:MULTISPECIES: helix-turn-helix domain-containing protein [Streptomyces]|uniref:Helix-turn-helix domain-containing protein n=1 Tax=Streptomyces bobili TaxID=67280 RepID=A0ABZ1R7G0_9ACTN|nr:MULTISPECIES: helix-turn-helix domain-containing protein [Streptomyces]